MCDSAAPPVNANATRGATIVAGYLDSPTASVAWTDAEWAHARTLAPELLPIWVADQYGDLAAGTDEATLAVAQARRLVPAGALGPFTVALDIEQPWAVRARESGYVAAWVAQVRALGWRPLLYTSRSVAGLFANVGAALWVAQWNGTPALAPGSAATQYASPVSDPSLSVDLSVVDQFVRLIPSGVNTRKEPNVPQLVGKIVALVPTHDNNGYWLVGDDGGVFAFGNAPALTMPAGVHPTAAVSTAAATSTSRGLWLASEAGEVFALGDAPYRGGVPDKLHLAPAPQTDPVPAAQ